MSLPNWWVNNPQYVYIYICIYKKVHDQHYQYGYVQYIWMCHTYRQNAYHERAAMYRWFRLYIYIYIGICIYISGWWFGLEHVFFHVLGMSSSQLTFIFFRGVGQPPTRYTSSAAIKDCLLSLLPALCPMTFPAINLHFCSTVPGFPSALPSFIITIFR